MADSQPFGPEKLQTASIRDDEGHNPGMVNEHDADGKPIPMSSPIFCNGVNMKHLAVIPNSIIPNEYSISDPRYVKYLGCRGFDSDSTTTHFFQHVEPRCSQLAKRNMRFILDGFLCPSHDR